MINYYRMLTGFNDDQLITHSIIVGNRSTLSKPRSNHGKVNAHGAVELYFLRKE